MKITVNDLRARKKSDVKIAMLTSYDYPTARILDRCGVDVQLVGDSVGTNVLGYAEVSMVTMDDMRHHCKAVSRGATHSFVLCDMPFGSCDTIKDALENALSLCTSGANGVKIETEKCTIEKIAAVVKAGIAVCGHIGYTPQTPGLPAAIQGKDLQRAKELVTLAQQCEQAGACMLVLELVPEKLAQLITQTVSIPTIGIGAGRHCDGQVLVILDILGLSTANFRHNKKYADASGLFCDAVTSYISDVRNGYFPTERNIALIADDVAAAISEWLNTPKAVSHDTL